jgi:hypothetical protein
MQMQKNGLNDSHVLESQKKSQNEKNENQNQRSMQMQCGRSMFAKTIFPRGPMNYASATLQNPNNRELS